MNLFQVVCDLLELVQEMNTNTQLAAHNHVSGPKPAPADAAAFTTKASQALVLFAKLKLITL